MTWTAPDVSPPDFPLTGDDRPVLEGFPAWHRALLRRKCAGLTGEQLARCPVPPSNLSLLSLVRHMAKGGIMSVRAVVIHMIEEYAQHNGHADLLRERIDGVTGK